MVHSTSRLAATELRGPEPVRRAIRLPFLEVSSVSEVESACLLEPPLENRIYTPWITLACSCRRSSPPITLAATP